ncbi:MAG: alpha-amylase, partial [Prevotella sp.]|nr:alpha-amylase [Prevotella sp.]
MKRLYTSIIILLAFMPMLAQGWPEKYDGIMLQGFYWDSYTDTNWANLESQADELSQYFSLIWVPNSAYANDLKNNMGYHPVYWFDHKSAFGTEAQLRSMIQTFKQKGTGIIEDVVINHRASVDGNWLNFPAETYKGETYQLTAADICQD